ncbi:hypothetical protein [Candidatus Aalborgicola defluviihabitans]|uniref:hypothetical protein n=1 Tax=Candidatus Aalborgicola defluviihabitans TaxID=3386187 RepID=UPI00390ABDA9|nr:hypothetical protein [Burkholderiales bacterium]
MKPVISLKINGADIMGLTDKDMDFDVIAFATLEIKNPVVVVSSTCGVTFEPYFQFATAVVTTINSNCIEAFLSEDRLPDKIVKKYRAFTAAYAKTTKQGKSA